MQSTGPEDRTTALKFWLLGTLAAVWVTGDVILFALSLAGFCVAIHVYKD